MYVRFKKKKKNVRPLTLYPPSPRRQRALEKQRSSQVHNQPPPGLKFSLQMEISWARGSIQPESVEKKRYAASPKLLLPIIIVFGRSECQTECAQGKETEHLSCFAVSFMYTLCMKEDFVVVVIIIANS